MSNDTYVSFYLSASKIHVYKKAITEIGNPRFVRFLMKEDGQSMIMESYHKKDFLSHRVPKPNPDKPWRLEISSMALCSLLKNRLNWEDGISYRIPGKIYGGQHLVVFDLSSAKQIPRET